jgi:uncharacterized protein (TIGR03067 family)
MKLLLILASFTISFIATKNPGSFVNDLNGVWIPVKQEIGGKPLPAALFEKQKLTINDSTYTFIAESVDKGTLKYSDNKMDIYGREGVNAGKHFTAIYKMESGQLTICYNLAGDSYPTDFETKSKSTLFLSVFKKQE